MTLFSKLSFFYEYIITNQRVICEISKDNFYKVIYLILLSDIILSVLLLFWFFQYITKDSCFFLACLHGTYGQNCAMTCGNCLENQTCDNVNGTCTNGCDEGFKDDFCKSGMIELELGFKNSSVFTSKERVVMIIIGGHYLLMSNFLTVFVQSYYNKINEHSLLLYWI